MICLTYLAAARRDGADKRIPFATLKGFDEWVFHVICS